MIVVQATTAKSIQNSTIKEKPFVGFLKTRIQPHDCFPIEVKSDEGLQPLVKRDILCILAVAASIFLCEQGGLGTSPCVENLLEEC